MGLWELWGQLGRMEWRPWRGMGGFINALAQTSARVDWDGLMPQHSVIPSSILT